MYVEIVQECEVCGVMSSVVWPDEAMRLGMSSRRSVNEGVLFYPCQKMLCGNREARSTTKAIECPDESLCVLVEDKV